MSNNLEKYKVGLVAGTLQTMMVYPFDVIRIRLFTKEMIGRWFYNGIIFTLITNIIKTGLYYPTQDIISSYLGSNRQITTNFIVGTLTGLITTPINAVKIPLQMSCNNKFQNVIREIYKKYGLGGFMRGAVPICLRDAIWTIVYFSMFNRANGHEHILLASLSSSLVATTLAYPFDGSRICMQHHRHQHSFWYGFKESLQLKQSNIKSFVVGNTRVSIATCIGHYTYLKLGKGEGDTLSP